MTSVDGLAAELATANNIMIVRDIYVYGERERARASEREKELERERERERGRERGMGWRRQGSNKTSHAFAKIPKVSVVSRNLSDNVCVRAWVAAGTGVWVSSVAGAISSC
jgi:hypothetical protein